MRIKISQTDAIFCLECIRSDVLEDKIVPFKIMTKEHYLAALQWAEYLIDNYKPEKAGEWIHTDECNKEWPYRCSVCNMPSRSNNHHYCSKCGSDMFARESISDEK